MRLRTRPGSFPKSEIKPHVLPKSQTKTIIPGWIWAVFVSSLLFFVGSFYVTSWTTTGPTFLPIEQSMPNASLNALAEYVNNPIKVGVRNLPEYLLTPGTLWETLQPLAIVAALCCALWIVPANNGSRLVIKSLIVLLGIRYMAWRTLGDTLNFTTGVSTIFSIWLYFVEVYSFILVVMSSFQSIWSSAAKRSAQADRFEQQIRAGEYLPSVDVFVPTYNEQAFIVRRTVMGCQAIDYPNKKIYMLDDARRPHMRALAKELGCGYITQPEGFVNPHAKAGNMNNALPRTDGELIAVFDADFVPFKNFLMRTVGFFQNAKVSLVQTPQDFYNPDYHVRNLGISHALPNDLQYFFQHQQSMMDTANSVVCCGTSFILRRSALESVGGFYTGCIPEDSSTSMKMSTRGFSAVYLSEKLSMGESPRNYKDFINQRLRWLQGNLQIFLRYKEIPLWTTLNWIQRSYFFTMLLGSFSSIVRATYLISPLVCLYLGTSNYLSTLPEFLYYGAPFILLMVGSFGWSCNYHASSFYNELYETIICFPSLGRLFATARAPFKRGFKVTAKGVTADSKNYNFNLTWPLIAIAVLTAVMIVMQLLGRRMGLWEAITSESYSLMFFWMIYNVLWLGVAVISAIDQPERRSCDRFPLKTPCKVNGTGAAWGHTHDVSEGGASITLMTEQCIAVGQRVTLDLLEHDLSIPAEIVECQLAHGYANVSVRFLGINIPQHRQLTELLYGKPTWWKQSKRLGTVDSMFSIAGSLLKLHPVLTAYDRPRASRSPSTHP
jgi:cellulose synthase (UDP-forming)